MSTFRSIKTLLISLDQSSSSTGGNRWNHHDCGEDMLIGSDQSLHIDPKSYYTGSCRAEAMVSQYVGIAYFEVRIVLKKERYSYGHISLGLSTRDFPLDDEWLPTYGDTYAYEMPAGFWGHNVEGSVPDQGNRRIAVANASFYMGDVVGCSVNLATRQIIYTLNGKRLSLSV
ncbi:hypothetical protein niasHS_000164 [Heterodera schachtii]|uniref:B30.2/SPRY domain-containing protein n=2 Tax=Heterodera TaxID=34509 RepID=A0ABD2KNI5_HETSC